LEFWSPGIDKNSNNFVQNDKKLWAQIRRHEQIMPGR
jgi:hypothetical protein